MLTNAHNEWVNMIVNGGIISAAAYLGIFASQLFRSLRENKDMAWLVGIAACISSYFFHNIFCYQQVTCTPFVFILIAIAEKMHKNV